MNKTLSINISGCIFNIEEDAYQVLYRYLEDIKGYFTASDGREEIMADIEARIAELLTERNAKPPRVVMLSDINAVMQAMGKPEEFSGNEQKSGAKQYTSAEADASYSGRKRVFRDGDDKLIGGVCSGISAYFDIDPLWLRLGFAATFLFFGSGLLFYILLWIVIPEAKTASEKLQMKGEKVDINNIGKQVNEEFERIKNRVKSEAKEFDKNIKPQAKNFVQRVVYFLEDIFSGLFGLFKNFFAVLIIFIGLCMLLALLSSIFGYSNVVHFNIDGQSLSYSIKDLMRVIFNNDNQLMLTAIGLFLLIGIPLLMLIYKGLRVMLNIKHKNRIFSTVASVLFIIGLVIISYVSVSMKKEFEYREKISEKINIPLSGNTLYLRSETNISESSEEEEEEETSLVFSKNTFVKINDSSILLGNIHFDVVKSTDDSFRLRVTRVARGENAKQAYGRAKQIDYHYTLTDTTLVLPRYFASGSFNKYRGQKINLRLYVPVGKSIFLNNSMEPLLYDVKNTSNMPDDEMTGKLWTMQMDGLTCVNCPPPKKEESRAEANTDEDSEESTEEY